MTAPFDKLARPVQKWIRAQGWRELRQIQSQAIDAITETDADLIIAANTAGGKTEAAYLPLISQILDDPAPAGGFDLLYISPLKALITDQAGRLKDICQEVDLAVTPWHGDVSNSVKTNARKKPRGILLITPESLEALFIRRGPEIPSLFSTTRAIIIDELHALLDSERGVQVRSLLTRVEVATGRSIRRLGLSATLGDMELARAYLRPDNPDGVQLIKADGADAGLQMQLRGYVAGRVADDEDANSPSVDHRIALHLFDKLRGDSNLVFAGSRQSVEIYSDRLRTLCEQRHLPQEFYPHHASLSRDHRSFVEKRMKDTEKPTTAVCTSTLELGIDIGDINSVAQIGAPFSVAGLRQRLGRSGRREGQPAVLRQYVIESALTSSSDYADRLRLRLIRSIAMIDLLLDRWCEPPLPQALHLSTLVHQILSVIAQRGGASADRLYRVLCDKGPFTKVTPSIFKGVLRALGHPDTRLIEQADDGLLLLGQAGEKLVEHFSFYAVFDTPEEYRLISAGKELGKLPMVNVMTPGMMLIFSGRRWIIEEIDNRRKVITLKPSKGGVPPIFGGGPSNIHDKVIEKMFTILESDTVPIYVDPTAEDLLAEARHHYAKLGFATSSIIPLSENRFAIATRVGTVKSMTLTLALQAEGLTVETEDGFLTVKANDESELSAAIHKIASGTDIDLFAAQTNLIFEKFHDHLSRPLLQLDALGARADLNALPGLCERIESTWETRSAPASV